MCTLCKLNNLMILITSLITICCSQKKNCDFRIEKAQMSYNNKDFKKAIDYSSYCINTCPGLLNAYLLRGKSYYFIEEFRNAVTDLRILTQADSLNTSALYYLGVSYYYLEKDDSAVLSYDKAIKTKGNDSIFTEFNEKYKDYLEDISMSQIKYHRAIANYQLGNNELALKDFNFAINNNFNKGSCYSYIGLMALYNGNSKMACKFLNEAIKYGEISATKYLPSNCED